MYIYVPLLLHMCFNEGPEQVQDTSIGLRRSHTSSGVLRCQAPGVRGEEKLAYDFNGQVTVFIGWEGFLQGDEMVSPRLWSSGWPFLPLIIPLFLVVVVVCVVLCVVVVCVVVVLPSCGYFVIESLSGAAVGQRHSSSGGGLFRRKYCVSLTA